MKNLHITLCVISLLVSSQVAVAYEVKTHREMSSQAVESSTFRVDGTIRESLGLKLELYSPNDPRGAANQKFPNSKGDEKDIFELLQDGSAFEDDGTRAKNHFFNPLTGEPLKVKIPPGILVPVGAPSPDWTLEDKGGISGQDDSFKDTRQFFFDALTLPSETNRKVKWGRTFQGLGQVIHHLQDMAQPEHSRVDAHLKYTPDGTPVNGPGEDPSRYEKYSGRKTNICTPLSLCAPYGPVQFDTARQFWVTKETGPDRGTGAGIAEFTNNNFVSKDTNFIDDALAPGLVEARPGYPFPDGSGARIEVKEFQELGIPPIETSYPIMPSPLDGKLYFIGTPVRDAYTNTIGFNDRTSTFSIYEPDLKKYSLDVEACNPNNDPPTSCHTRAIFTLNNFNFDAAHQFLVKRAIGYSAGMINYFFRGIGQLDLAEDPTDPTRLLLQNLGDETLDGIFTLYYDDADGNRTPVPGAQWTTSLSGHSQLSVSKFLPPSIPAPKKPGEYLLVFKGTMGQETDIAVAASTIHPPAPESFLLDHRLSLTIDQNNQWVATEEEDLQYGEVDWQGSAGILTYHEAKVSNTGTVEYGNTIYRGGRVLAVAPPGYQVLAAALQPDPDNPPHPRLVAILRLPSSTPGTPAAGGVWTKALAGTQREWHQQFDLDLSIGYSGIWRFNQAGTKVCTIGYRPTSFACTYFEGPLQYPGHDCTSSSETFVVDLDVSTGGWTESSTVATQSHSRSERYRHIDEEYSGTVVIAADYRNNVLTVATAQDSFSQESEEHFFVLGPYSIQLTRSYAFAIDGSIQVSAQSTFAESGYLTLYTNPSRYDWNSTGSFNLTGINLVHLDLRHGWFAYTIARSSGGAAGGTGPWPATSTLELKTSDGDTLYSLGGSTQRGRWEGHSVSGLDGPPAEASWVLDRHGNVLSSVNVPEESTGEVGPTWINRLNGADISTLTGMTGEIPEIGIR